MITVDTCSHCFRTWSSHLDPKIARSSPIPSITSSGSYNPRGKKPHHIQLMQYANRNYQPLSQKYDWSLEYTTYVSVFSYTHAARKISEQANMERPTSHTLTLQRRKNARAGCVQNHLFLIFSPCVTLSLWIYNNWNRRLFPSSWFCTSTGPVRQNSNTNRMLVSDVERPESHDPTTQR